MISQEDAVRYRAWFDELQPKLGSTQLTHASAQIDAWKKESSRYRDQVQRWAELLSKGHRDRVEAEMEAFLRG